VEVRESCAIPVRLAPALVARELATFLIAVFSTSIVCFDGARAPITKHEPDRKETQFALLSDDLVTHGFDCTKNVGVSHGWENFGRHSVEQVSQSN
jgi:hypothetical protein